MYQHVLGLAVIAMLVQSSLQRGIAIGRIRGELVGLGDVGSETYATDGQGGICGQASVDLRYEGGATEFGGGLSLSASAGGTFYVGDLQTGDCGFDPSDNNLNCQGPLQCDVDRK